MGQFKPKPRTAGTISAKRPLGGSIAAALAAALTFGAANAQAATTYIGNVNLQVGPSSSGSYHAGGVTSDPASYGLSVDGAYGTSITTNALGGSVYASGGGGAGNTSGEADATISYYLEVVGPAGPDVPVEVLASGYANGSGLYTLGGSSLPAYTAQAQFSVQTDTTPVYGQANTSTGSGAFSVDETGYFSPDFQYIVNLFVQAGGHGIKNDDGSVTSGTAQAYIDPQFIIDPAYASLYHIVGVPVTPSAPEPESWALMILGVGIAGTVLRRRALRRGGSPLSLPSPYSG